MKSRTPVHASTSSIARLACAVFLIAAAACGAPETSGGDDDDDNPDVGHCGNNVCDSGESSATCAKDCPACGNKVCDSGESPTSCPQDCPVCGDNKCDPTETATSCAQDCTATLQVFNQSNYTINHFYIYRCTDTTEGPDQLNGRWIYPGGTAGWTKIPPDCYLLHATNTSGTGWRTPTGLTMRSGEKYTWTLN